MKKDKLAKEWFLKAQDDEMSIKDILHDREDAPNTVCFLAQQLAKKYLKGYLAANNARFSKIHQLDRLIKLCGEFDPSFERLKKEAEYLSACYIVKRYSVEFPQLNFDDAEKAFDYALKIKQFVIDSLE